MCDDTPSAVGESSVCRKEKVEDSLKMLKGRASFKIP